MDRGYQSDGDDEASERERCIMNPRDRFDGDDADRERGCIESSCRCLCIPCSVVGAVSRACCCPAYPRPPEWSTRFALLIALMRAVTHNVVRSVSCIRCLTDQRVPTWLPTLPNGLLVYAQRVGGDSRCPCPGEWVAPGAIADPRTNVPFRVVFYLHGGAFALCKPETHRGVTMRIATAAAQRDDDIAVFSVDYRRPPEAQYPAPVDDCVASYKWLLERMGGGADAASRIVLAGDSAGGALVVLACAALRREGVPLPAGGIMLSPWVDLRDTTLPSWEQNKHYDYLPSHLACLFSEEFVKGSEYSLEQASATNQDLSGLPPLFIINGEKECIRDQGAIFADKARAAGVDVHYTVEQGMVHAFVAFSDVAEIESVDRWFGNMASFIDRVTGLVTIDSAGMSHVRVPTKELEESSQSPPSVCRRYSYYYMLLEDLPKRKNT